MSVACHRHGGRGGGGGGGFAQGSTAQPRGVPVERLFAVLYVA